MLFFDMANSLILMGYLLFIRWVKSVRRPAFTYFPSRIKIEQWSLASYTRAVPHGTQAKGKPAVMPGRKASDLSHPGQTAGLPRVT